MKPTLEKALAMAKPGTKTKVWANLDQELEHYIDALNLRNEVITETLKVGASIKEMSRRWGTLMWLFGLMYRIRIEHNREILIDSLGLTLEEDRQVVNALGLLKGKFQHHNRTEKNSATKMLYDKISSIGY